MKEDLNRGLWNKKSWLLNILICVHVCMGECMQYMHLCMYTCVFAKRLEKDTRFLDLSALNTQSLTEHKAGMLASKIQDCPVTEYTQHQPCPTFCMGPFEIRFYLSIKHRYPLRHLSSLMKWLLHTTNIMTPSSLEN